MAKRKVVNARITNDSRVQKLHITYDDGTGEHTYYQEAVGYHNILGYLDLDELIGMDEEDLYYAVRNAATY